MIDDNEVVNEGFTPLRRIPTEPTTISRGTRASNERLHSFHGDPLTKNQRKGEQALFEQSSWSILEKSRGRRLSRGNSFIGDSSINTRSRATSNASSISSPTKPSPLEAATAGIDSMDIDYEKNSESAIVVVDPFSTGAHIASGICKLGESYCVCECVYICVCVVMIMIIIITILILIVYTLSSSLSSSSLLLLLLSSLLLSSLSSLLLSLLSSSLSSLLLPLTGYKCVRVLAIWDSPVAALIQKGINADFVATVQHNDTLDDQGMWCVV